MEEDSLTESYGDPTVNSRAMGGGVDFFSNLGTERKRKEKEKPADKVSISTLWLLDISLMFVLFFSLSSVRSS